MDLSIDASREFYCHELSNATISNTIGIRYFSAHKASDLQIQMSNKEWPLIFLNKTNQSFHLVSCFFEKPKQAHSN